MRRANDLFGCIPEQGLHADECEILPHVRLARLADKFTAPAAFRAAAAIFIGLHCQMQFRTTVLELKMSDLHAFQA